MVGGFAVLASVRNCHRPLGHINYPVFFWYDLALGMGLGPYSSNCKYDD